LTTNGQTCREAINVNDRSNRKVISGRLSVVGASYPDRLDCDKEDSLRFRLATTRSELYAAFRLLQARYLATGLTKSHQPIRVEPFHLWRESQVLIATRLRRIVGCLTFVRPGPRGLPSERTHASALESVPFDAKVGEVTSFAIARQSHIRSVDIFLGLTQLVQKFGLYNDIEYVFAVVHPRHARFYQKSIGFQMIGDAVPCQRVDGNPGVALLGRIDRNTVSRSQWKSGYAPEATIPAGPLDLRPRSMNQAQREFFARFQDHTTVGKATMPQRKAA